MSNDIKPNCRYFITKEKCLVDGEKPTCENCGCCTPEEEKVTK